MHVHDTLYGFTVTALRPLPDIQAQMAEMTHTRSGARLIWLDRDDHNMTFSIAFKTIPEDDTGVFHILEHSVLCGSRKYPVKEPFVNLLQTSLQTFLNAITFPDKTMYPVSSRNEKDFLNLVDVYLDAVFHPAIDHKEDIFRQEGWHYEYDEDGKLTRSGVVYSEMKGAYGSVETQLSAHMNRLLYPDTCYRFDSGGVPEHIPELTYEHFLACHRRYYHPSNAYIVLDGAVPLEATLRLLDTYLRAYDRTQVDVDVPDQPPISPASYEGVYAADGQDDRGQYAASWVYGRFDEREKTLAMEVLGDVLCSSNESPLRKAVLEAGLAEAMSLSGSDDGAKYQAAHLTVRNVTAGKLSQLKETIRTTLEELCQTGLDRQQLHAAINAMEFAMRECDFGSMPKGLIFAIYILDSWLYGGDPALKLSLGDIFAELRTKVDSGYYEQLLRSAILDNPHRGEVYLIPSADLEAHRRQAQEAELSQIAAQWSAAQQQRVRAQQEALLATQQAEDTPEALATLPRLTLADVPERPDPLLLDAQTVAGTDVVFSAADTSGIVYGELYFAAPELSEEEVSTAAFLVNILDEMGTAAHSADTLQALLKTHLGAFSCSLVGSSKYGQADTCTPYLTVSFSVLEKKVDRAVELVGEVLGQCLFANRERVGQILRQKKLALYENIIDSGSFYAAVRVSASGSARGVVNEYAAGLEQYRWLCRAEKQFQEDPTTLLEQLSALYRRIFTRPCLTLSLTGRRAAIESLAPRLIAAIRDGDGVGSSHIYRPFPVSREGIVIPADVSFTAMGANLYRHGLRYGGHMGVAASVLTYTYLWNVIRVQNGAYGAGMSVGDLGELRLTTYRDPNAANSLATFAEAGAYLAENVPDHEALESLIIGAIGETDPLRTPRGRGKLALTCHLMGLDDEHFHRMRREMLETRPEDLADFGQTLQSLTAHAAVCVVGSRELAEACGEQLERIIPLN